MVKIVLILLGMLVGINLHAQVKIDFQKCREMALESSKKMAVANKQVVKAGYDKKAYRANFFPKLSAMGMYAYMQKDYSFRIEGGNLPTFVPGEMVRCCLIICWMEMGKWWWEPTVVLFLRSMPICRILL